MPIFDIFFPTKLADGYRSTIFRIYRFIYLYYFCVPLPYCLLFLCNGFTIESLHGLGHLLGLKREIKMRVRCSSNTVARLQTIEFERLCTSFPLLKSCLQGISNTSIYSTVKSLTSQLCVGFA